MCSDDLTAAGLEPNYDLEWKELMKRLVKFILGDQISIETWNNKEIAVLKSKGCVLSRVAEVENSVASGGNVQSVKVVLRNISGRGRGGIIRWTLRISAKHIQNGDLIYLLQGASKPTIARLRNNHFEIIMTTVILPEKTISRDWDITWPEPSQSASFIWDFLLVWD
jgi:hypothetical protein